MSRLDIIDIGRRVKELRLARRLTQAELARRMFVSRSFISLVETAKTTPSLTSLYAIATALGVGIEELIPGSNTEVNLSDPLVQVSAANAHLLNDEQKNALRDLIRSMARGEA